MSDRIIASAVAPPSAGSEYLIWVDTTTYVSKRYSPDTSTWVVDSSAEGVRVALEEKLEADSRTRCLVQRYGTWLWLDTDCSLITDGPEWALDEYGITDATVHPQTGNPIMEDGRRMFERYGTLVHIERGTGSSRTRWTAIVTDCTLTNGRWQLELSEWPSFMDGLPIRQSIVSTGADASQVVGQVMSKANAAARGFDVGVIGNVAVGIGTTSTLAVKDAKHVLAAAERQLNATKSAKNSKKGSFIAIGQSFSGLLKQARAAVTAQKKVVASLSKPPRASKTAIAAAKAELKVRQQTVKSALQAYNASKLTGKQQVSDAENAKAAAQIAVNLAKNTLSAAVAQEKADGGEYRISAIDFPDMYKTIQDLAMEGFEWSTRSDPSTGAPSLSLVLHQGQAGTTRDLVFEQGVNIVSKLELSEGDEYANIGYGIGAGEGSGALRSSYAASSTRLLRPVTVEDRSLQRQSQINLATKRAVLRAAGGYFVPEVLVIDCMQTPIGSWQIGDRVTVVGFIEGWGRYAQLQRIIGWQMAGPHRARVRFERV